ncbi:hypothetical protein KFK09_023125 [Dendrobium nobile]|uniref:Uncharacterized protein n=1 Tax=Dendrobium nobile TaxID=94219 RepID=A0A8T3ALF5_DENNO|nr:hypothetical protein KFK09_023125 [Dendrobium nobile]
MARKKFPDDRSETAFQRSFVFLKRGRRKQRLRTQRINAVGEGSSWLLALLRKSQVAVHIRGTWKPVSEEKGKLFGLFFCSCGELNHKGRRPRPRRTVVVQSVNKTLARRTPPMRSPPMPSLAFDRYSRK